MRGETLCQRLCVVHSYLPSLATSYCSWLFRWAHPREQAAAVTHCLPSASLSVVSSFYFDFRPVVGEQENTAITAVQNQCGCSLRGKRSLLYWYTRRRAVHQQKKSARSGYNEGTTSQLTHITHEYIARKTHNNAACMRLFNGQRNARNTVARIASISPGKLTEKSTQKENEKRLQQIRHR